LISRRQVHRALNEAAHVRHVHTYTYEEQHVEASRARDGGVERPQAVGGHEEQAALLPPQIVQLS
jgi:hypothetical protein